MAADPINDTRIESQQFTQRKSAFYDSPFILG